MNIIFTKEQVQTKNTAEQLWVIIDKKVYDVTQFKDEHPGGVGILLENGGTDVSERFLEIVHSNLAQKMLVKYQIGVLDNLED